MNTRRWKLVGIVTLAAGLLSPACLKAQTPLPLTLASGTGEIDFRSDGTIVASGTGGASLTDGDLQSGSRFVWNPSLSAIRAGAGWYMDGVAATGQYSAAFGMNSLAFGPGSMAFGYNAVATGQGAVALNSGMGNAQYSTGMGYISGASGFASTAMGFRTTANGSQSLSTGSNTIANGVQSVAMGANTLASACNSLAIGQFNTRVSETGGTPSATSWVAADPVFQIGKGTATNARSDAMVVYKNGDMVVSGTSAIFQGVVTVQPGGDVPMYTGN